MAERPKDIHLNAAGDLQLGHNGDLACSYDDDVRVDGIIFRLKTYAGDYDLEPGCGASLEDFIGKPNTLELGDQVRARAFAALTHDRFIDPRDLELDVAPLDDSTLVIAITVRGIRGTFGVVSSLDLLTGKIKAIPGIIRPEEHFMEGLPYAGLKVAALAADLDACGHYRLVHPFAQLERLGAAARVFSKVTHDELRDFQIIVSQRQSKPEVVKLLSMLRREGRLIIAETDDMLDAIHPANPAYSAYMPGSPAQKAYREILSLAHGITVTTPELADHYRSLNRNIHVVPNCIDFGIRRWPEPVFRDDATVTIGWTGSTSHIVDMNVLGPVLESVMAKYPHVRYAHFSSRQLLDYLLANFRIPDDRVSVIEPVDFDTYPSRVGLFDIGLAPLANSVFNQAKSPLKLMEYAAAGVPFVASKVAPYTRYTDQGVDGFVAATTSEWGTHISTLVEDTARRKRISEAAYAKVRERHSIEFGAASWVRAWAAVRDAVMCGDVGPGQAPENAHKPGRNEPCPCGSGSKYKRCCSPSWG